MGGNKHERMLAIVLIIALCASFPAYAESASPLAMETYDYSGRTIYAVTAQLVPTLLRALLCTGVTVGGAWLGRLGKRDNAAARVGLFAASAFLAYGAVSGVVTQGNAVTFIDALLDAAVFMGLYFLTVSLCRAPMPALRLHREGGRGNGQTHRTCGHGFPAQRRGWQHHHAIRHIPHTRRD